ncbi:MAG: ABC transporter substrate-binding protein [Alphaproteobacteria bacterium]|nr:ABC transporter substrate-binding protein [Alphaproteobacteria bacterium]
MTFRLVPSLLAGFLACCIAGTASLAQQSAPQTAQASPPVAVIEKLGSAMMDTMKNAKQLGYQGRFQKLAPAIVEAYDLPRMVSVAVGGAWKQTTPDQQQRLVDAFARYTVAVHASRLDGYSGETFRIAGSAPVSNGLTRVKAQFVRSSGATEDIDYVMQEDGGRWRIVDVFYKSSISEVATRRSEYTAVIKNAGVEQLIAKMDEKTAELGHSRTATN